MKHCLEFGLELLTSSPTVFSTWKKCVRINRSSFILTVFNDENDLGLITKCIRKECCVKRDWESQEIEGPSWFNSKKQIKFAIFQLNNIYFPLLRYGSLLPSRPMPIVIQRSIRMDALTASKYLVFPLQSCNLIQKYEFLSSGVYSYDFLSLGNPINLRLSWVTSYELAAIERA